VFSRTEAPPAPRGDICECVALPGELTAAQLLARVPSASTLPPRPPQVASRGSALGYLRARRSEIAGPQAALARAAAQVRNTRDPTSINLLHRARSEVDLYLQTLDGRIASLQNDPAASPQVLAYQMQTAVDLVQRVRELVDQARSGSALDCWCGEWGPRASHVRFGTVLIAHRPRRRDVHSVVYVLDGQEIHRAAGTPEDVQGTVPPGAHRLEAITTLQSGRKLTTRGSFHAGPPWALAVEHRLTSSGSRFSRQRLPDPFRGGPPGVP
jgi:hypothetical protein